MDTNIFIYVAAYLTSGGYGLLALRHQSYRWRSIAALVMTAGFVSSLLYVLYHLFLFGFVLVICGVPAMLFGDQNDIEGATGFAGGVLADPVFLANVGAGIILLITLFETIL
jgi:hypothetical protein